MRNGTLVALALAVGAALLPAVSSMAAEPAKALHVAFDTTESR